MPSFKTVAITRNSPRRPEKTRAAAAEIAVVGDEPAAVATLASSGQRPARAMQAPPSHRYRIGERLRMGHGGNTLARTASFCKVVMLLPYEGYGALLYRVRSDAESFERVVAEADLSRT